MKVSRFKYKKKKTGEIKDYNVLVLNESEKHMGGIDYSKLDEPEISEATKIQIDYEKKLQPFVKKAYRMFIKENIQEDDSSS
jgi:hypothetical protein